MGTGVRIRLFYDPVVDDCSAVRGDDRFRVILDSVEREAFVIERHDVSLFIECTYFKRGGEGSRVYNPRVVAPYLHGRGYPPV